MEITNPVIASFVALDPDTRTVTLIPIVSMGESTDLTAVFASLAEGR